MKAYIIKDLDYDEYYPNDIKNDWCIGVSGAKLFETEKEAREAVKKIEYNGTYTILTVYKITN